jgi:hypothetical protein
LFKLFRLVWWMCVHPLLCLLFSFSIHKWNPGFITCDSYSVIEKFIAILVVLLWKSKLKPFLRFVCTGEHFLNPSCAKLVIAYSNFYNLVENSAWNLLKFTWKFWNCEAPSFTKFLVNTLNKMITHYRWPVDYFALHREH